MTPRRDAGRRDGAGPFARSTPPQGLAANWPQFTLLVVLNGFVGALVGLERTVLPLLAEAEFGLASAAAALSFLISFGITKALANLFAGGLADRLGRRPVLIAGWLIGVPAPLLIIAAPAWDWVVLANVLLGINQGLCWSMTVVMKIDLVGPRQRGLAMGLNESAGYVSVSLAALLAGYLAAAEGIRAAPFYPGVGFALAGLCGSLFVRETRAHARQEARAGGHAVSSALRFAEVFLLGSWKDRTLWAFSQAGMVNNLNDAMVWGLIPIVLARSGLPLEQVGVVAAAYPGVWGLGQLVTGALSDRWDRRVMIVAGMWVQALAIALFAAGRAFPIWLAASVFLGAGTALVYPTLLAAVSDAAHPDWRATAVGVYRLWRDGGYAVGAVLSGVLADRYGSAATIWVVAALTAFSGIPVLVYARPQPPARTMRVSARDTGAADDGVPPGPLNRG